MLEIFHQGSWLINGNDLPKDQFQASARIDQGKLYYPSDAETSFLKGYSSFYAYINLRCTPTHVTHIKEFTGKPW